MHIEVRWPCEHSLLETKRSDITFSSEGLQEERCRQAGRVDKGLRELSNSSSYFQLHKGHPCLQFRITTILCSCKIISNMKTANPWYHSQNAVSLMPKSHPRQQLTDSKVPLSFVLQQTSKIQFIYELRIRRREHFRALGQPVNIPHAQHGQPCICSRIILIPMLLTIRACKHLPLICRARILGQYNVAVEAEHLFRERTGAHGLVVEESVPHAGGAVLRIFGARGVYEKLLGCSVCAEEGREVVGADRFVFEEGDEGVGGVVDAWKQAIWGGLRAVFAADEGADTGS